jgi:hypothetical protein
MLPILDSLWATHFARAAAVGDNGRPIPKPVPVIVVPAIVFLVIFLIQISFRLQGRGGWDEG